MGRNGKYQKTNKAKTIVMCDVKKGCGKPASFEFMTMDLDLKMTTKSGCDACIKDIQKGFPVMIDATGDEVVVKHNK